MQEINGFTRAPTVVRALEGIRDRIVLCEFQGGETLTENALASEYAVSRGSIRSVLYMLESEGLISTQPNGRRLVIGITEKFIEDLYETRILLECEASNLCIQKSNLDYSRLANALAQFYTLQSAPKEMLYIERANANTRFHRALIETAENRSLLQCWETVEPLTHALSKLNYLTLADKTNDDELTQSHTAILDMVIKKNADIARHLRQHIHVAIGESIDGWRQRLANVGSYGRA